MQCNRDSAQWGALRIPKQTWAPDRQAAAAGSRARKHLGLRYAGLAVLFLFPPLALAADGDKPFSATERINYSVGYQIGADFRGQGVELSPELLVQGVRDALKQNAPLLSPEQMKETLVQLKKQLVEGERLQQKQSAQQRKEAGLAFMKQNAAQKGVTVLPGGVQYRVLKAGSGPKPTVKDDVTIKYRVTGWDGKEIANTAPQQAQSYTVAKALPGLQEVLQLMPEGSKWQVVLPPGTTSDRDPLNDLGPLIYELELVSVQAAK